MHRVGFKSPTRKIWALQLLKGEDCQGRYYHFNRHRHRTYCPSAAILHSKVKPTSVYRSVIKKSLATLLKGLYFYRCLTALFRGEGGSGCNVNPFDFAVF